MAEQWLAAALKQAKQDAADILTIPQVRALRQELAEAKGAHPVIAWARPQTFDEDRERPRICGCGHHHITGRWSSPYCPWKREPTPATWGARWAQPEQEPLAE